MHIPQIIGFIEARSMNWRFTKVPEFSFSLTACPSTKTAIQPLKKKNTPQNLFYFSIEFVW